MIREVVEVKSLGAYRLWIKFDNGVDGEIDMKDYLSFKGVFEPLKDFEKFSQVSVDPIGGVLCWPGDVDIDSWALYSHMTGEPIILNELYGAVRD